MRSCLAMTLAVMVCVLAGCGGGGSNIAPTPWTGVLRGFVRDSSGSPVQGVTVVGDDGSYTAITGPDGHYTMDYVLPGTHWLSATKPGYSSVTVSSLAITANVVNTQDFTISQLGQGADAILAATSDNSLVLTGPATAIPAGVVPVIRSASRTDAGLGTGGSGSLAVAGLYPAGTTFSESVTLTFHLDTAVAADKEVALWQLDSSDNWNPAGIAVSLSEDRKTASITIDSFNPQLYIHLVAGPRR